MAEQQQKLQALTEDYQKLEQGQLARKFRALTCCLTIAPRITTKYPIPAEARIPATGKQASPEGIRIAIR
jgi:hypothetical protein